MSNKYKDILASSIKSTDTEEWLDMHFTRPVGLVIALACKRVGIHPNAVTAVSMVLGVAAAVMFAHTDLWHNALGVVLLMLANFCDSADGQLARLTGKKTLVGRVLDGFAGDLWFFCIYAALCLRLMGQPVPSLGIAWGPWIWVVAFIAGVLCHSPQSSLADYYRQIHLLFIKGKAGSELDTYAAQRAIYDSLPKHGALLSKLFYYNYSNYCKSQERRTPAFQRMMAVAGERYGGIDRLPDGLREEFISGSRPLMKYTNILTFNTRAICIYITCLAGCPWVYMLFEITVLTALYTYMHKKHETLCAEITKKAI